MANPVIGVTTYHGQTRERLPAVMLLRAYVTALVQAGGIPVLIPGDLAAQHRGTLFARLDGILFSGGGDIAVEHFNGTPHPRVGEVDPQRDALEIELLRAAAQDGKPFLGICRGCQVMNVALGGTLYTHIADQHPQALKHDYYPDVPRNYLAHPLRVEQDSHLAAILGATHLQVNSLHHQGLEKVASDLKPVAYAPDGLVEAVELCDHPFAIGVQWHPEWLTDQPAMWNLFQAFVEAAEYAARNT